MSSPWGPPSPHALPGWGRGGFKTPATPAGPRRRRPPRPGLSRPLLRCGSARRRGPRPGAGGTPPPGHPAPGTEPPAGPAAAGSEEEVSQEQPEAPESETSRRRPRRRRRHCGEGRRGGRRDGLVGRRGKEVLRLFRCCWEPEARGPLGATPPLEEAGLGDPGRPPHRLGRLLPACPLRGVLQAALLRTSLAEPRTRTPAEHPDLGRTPCPPPSAASLSPEPLRIQDPLLREPRDGIFLRPASASLFKTTHLWDQISPISVFFAGYGETTDKRPLHLRSTSAPFALRASAPPHPHPDPPALPRETPRPL